MRVRILPILALSYIANLGDLSAAEVDYGLGIQFGAYDNILRTEVSAGKVISKSLVGMLAWNENTVDLVGSVNLQAELTKYTYDIVRDTNQVDLNADFLWGISPNHYEWQLNNVLTHTAIDSSLSDTPANRQYVNSFSTGPNLKWRFGKVDQVLIKPRFEDYYFENSVLNNRRLNNIVEWVHAPSKNITLGLSNKLERTSYSSSRLDDSDYQQVDIDANISYIKNKNTFLCTVGLTRLESNSFDTNNKNQYNIIFNHQRTSTSNLEFNLSKVVTDTSRSVSTVRIDDLDVLTTSNDLFVNKKQSITYNKKFRTADLSLSVLSNSENYFNQNDLDRKIKTGRLNLRWINTSNSAFMVDSVVSNIEYTDQLNDRIDDDINTTLAYQYKTNANINYSFSLSKIKRESNTNVESFEDKVILFSIIYSTNNRNI